MNLDHQQQLLNSVIRDYYPEDSESPPSSEDSDNATKELTQLGTVGASQFHVCHSPVVNLSSTRHQTSEQPACSDEVAPEEACEVCGDKSSGTHYGVYSCEGCKGFFRRQMQRRSNFRCRRDQNCEISKVTRLQCKYCRFQKCLLKGMRVKNPRKSKSTEIKAVSNKVPGISAEIINLIKSVSFAHQQTFPNMADLRMFTYPTQAGESNSLTPETYKTELQSWQNFSNRCTNSLKKIVDFAKSLPGFTDFTRVDQINMLQSACLEIMFLRLCSRYTPLHDTLTFSDGLTLTREQMRKCGPGPMTDQMFAFANSFSPLDADPTEVGLLSAICLMSPDRPDLKEPWKVEKMQELLSKGLRHYVLKRRPKSTQMYSKLLLKLTALRTISHKGVSRVKEVKAELGSIDELMNKMILSDKPDDISYRVHL